MDRFQFRSSHIHIKLPSILWLHTRKLYNRSVKIHHFFLHSQVWMWNFCKRNMVCSDWNSAGLVHWLNAMDIKDVPLVSSSSYWKTYLNNELFAFPLNTTKMYKEIINPEQAVGIEEFDGRVKGSKIWN